MKFESKTTLLMEELSNRYANSVGIIMGDCVKFKKNALKHEKLKDKAQNYLDQLNTMMKSDLPIKVASIKSSFPSSSNELIGEPQTGKDVWIDIYLEPAPGSHTNIICVPSEILELANDGIHIGPIAKSIIKDDPTTIKPEDVKNKDDEYDERNLDGHADNHKLANKFIEIEFSNKHQDQYPGGKKKHGKMPEK